MANFESPFVQISAGGRRGSALLGQCIIWAEATAQGSESQGCRLSRLPSSVLTPSSDARSP